jgi:hypothetical protein
MSDHPLDAIIRWMSDRPSGAKKEYREKENLERE